MRQQRINNYLINKELGKGANGQVYLAIKDEDKQQYALKLQQFEISEDEQEIIKELGKHNLKNVVRSYDHFVYTLGFMEYNCIAMDYCNQGDLQDFFFKYRKNAQVQEIRDMIFQIAFGIWELHQFNIVHRDLKPQNILLHISDNQLFLKLCDLGLSKISKGNILHTVNIGTPYYMAPELIQNTESENYDSSVDIWALGVIIFDFFSEEQLFFGKNLNIIFNYIKTMDIRQRLNAIKDLDLKRICESCLNRDPKKRPIIKDILLQLNKEKFEKQQKILQNDQQKLLQSQLKINNTMYKNKESVNLKNDQNWNQQNQINHQSQTHPEEQQNNQMQEQCSQLIKLTNEQIRLQVQILSKIKDKRFATNLVIMHSNSKSEDEILQVLKAKGDQLIKLAEVQY